MGFLKDRMNIQNATSITLQDSELLRLLGIDGQNIRHGKLGEITYFTCLKHLSECMGKLPIRQYREDAVKGKEKVRGSYLDYILNTEPNPYMTASTFWQTVELNRNHYGNAYVYQECYTIGRNAGQIKALWILPSNQVTIWMDDAGFFGKQNAIWYVWQDQRGRGKQYKFRSEEILHYKSSVSWDGIVGLAVKDILKIQIETAQYGQSYLGKLYKNNMFGGKVILNYTGDLDRKREKTLAEKIESYSSSVGSGKFIPLPLGITAQTLDMKLSDAEFADLNKLSALQIAGAFGIKPNILNNYDKSSYSNSETQQLDFYVNSFMPTLKGYKEENTRRLLTSKQKNDNNVLEHDIKELFKLDPVKQIGVLQKGINNFIYTANEAREEMGLPYSDEPSANELIGNGNYIKISQIGSQWKGGVKR